MKKETKKRIQLYEERLPAMKEKVAGAVLMLVMAITMMVSVTFAWITLSSSPEATSIDTTVIANGNLEIALSPPDGSAPGKSAVGDSFAAQGNSLTRANVTWGNLVNLSDKSYGLEKITLRPAALNGTSGLLTNPLYGVAYGVDGRVTEMTTENDFAFVYYDNEKGELMVDSDSAHHGVRAVSTVKYVSIGGDNTWAEMATSVSKAKNAATNNYSNMTDETSDIGAPYIKSLEGLMAVYAQNQIDRKAENTLDVSEYVPNLYEMLKYMDEKVFLNVGNAYLLMADMCEFIEHGDVEPWCGYDLDSLCTAALNETLPAHINIASLKQFAKDRADMDKFLLKREAEDFSDLTDAEKKSSLAYWAYMAGKGEKVYWSDIKSVINWAVEINSCTVDGYPMSSLRSHAVDIVFGDSPHDAVINGGVLYRMEQRIGAKMDPEITITVDASSIVSLVGEIDLTAVVTTSAAEPYEMETDLEKVKDLNEDGNFKGGDAVAEDTYALSVDMWLRTNGGSQSTENTVSTSTDADGNEITTVISPETSFLTLEGHVLTTEQTVAATMKDLSGNQQPAYVATVTLESGEAVTVDVFERYGNYYCIVVETNAETGEEESVEVVFEDYVASQYSGQTTIEYTAKMITEQVVIGYEGENRVWTDDQLVAYQGEGTSTTEGSGSCYIFYADTPADQARFLELLSAMRVVFVNSAGKQIGVAEMDTENYYAENGKVTVPLTLVKNIATNLGVDGDGNELYGLMELKNDVATRVTALVYLDGTKLTNDMVLASGDIQGSLNIQFGCANVTKVETTTVDTEGVTSKSITYTQGKENLAIKDSPLMDDYVQVTANASETDFDFDPDNLPTTSLEVNINGIEPKSVSARFVRAVSSTQGSLMGSFAFAGSGNRWSKDYTFEKPGTYILRSVWVDGVEYELNQEEPVTIKVTGSTVTSLVCDAISENNKATIMTADSEYKTNLTLGFSTSKALPETVNGIFLDEDGRQVTVAFEADESGTLWKGTAAFTSSGTYTMGYVEVDGELYELSESLQPTLEILLGLKVRTWITCSAETLAKLQTFNETATATNFTLVEPVSLEVSAEVYDNNGNEIVGLADVILNYGKDGSARDKVDSNMVWDSSTGRYEGIFQMDIAGSYNFRNLMIGNNVISRYTNAPGILAMPPEDAYYYDDYTTAYQYAPSKDAVMTIGVAYSSAVGKMEATMTRNGESVTVEGTRGLEVPTGEEVSVNYWNFTVPEVDGTQEGEWTLDSITMYGVYYEDQFYPSDGAGVTVDLASENILTKVVNNVYVTVNGTSEEFTNYFAEPNTVDDITITIADYEGEPIQYYEEDTLKNASVTELKIVYYLDYAGVSMETYGYTAEGLESVTVDGRGTLRSGSETEYSVSALDFRYAGQYKNADISFALNGTAFTEKDMKLKYIDGGVPSGSNPVYTVKWTAPTVTITDTRYKPNISFKHNALSTSNSLKVCEVYNHVDKDGFYARLYSGHSSSDWGVGTYCTVTLPKILLKLTGGGSQVTETNKVTFTIPTTNSNFSDNIFEFTSDNQETGPGDVGNSEKTNTIGQDYATYMPDVIIEHVTMMYEGKPFNVKLSHPVEIKSSPGVPASLDFVIPSTHESMFDAPEMQKRYDGRLLEVELPKLTFTEQTAIPVGETVNVEKTREIVRKITWTTGSGCDEETHTGEEVTPVTEIVATGTFVPINRTYMTSQWTINGKNYNSGTTWSTASGAYMATAVITYEDSDPIGEPYETEEVLADQTSYGEVIYRENGQVIAKPSGFSYVD